MNSLSFLVCPLTGLICDKLSLPRIKSASFIMIFIIVIEATISFLPLIEAPWPVYVMAVLFPIGRTFFYGVSNLVRSYTSLTDTAEKKIRHRTVCPFRGHLAPRLFLIRFSFFDRNSCARIRMALKAPHSPVSVNQLRIFYQKFQ